MRKYFYSYWQILPLIVWVIAFPWPVGAQHADETVVVTATPGSQSTGELAQSVTVLGGEELARVRALNIGETLAGQLGMSASSFGAGASRPVIRGLAGARIRTMEDGIETMDIATVSADHAVGVDPLIARQIEIFRGPTTLLYGSGAVGGVVNTVTNRIPDFAPEDEFDAAFEVRGNTVADERTFSVAFDGGGADLAWHFDVTNRETDDYELPGSLSFEQDSDFLANSDLQLESYSLGGSWLGERGSFGLSVSEFETQYGIPGHEGDEERVRIDLEQTRVNIKGAWYGASGFVEAINLRIGISDYEHVEIEDLEIGTRFENDAYEARLEFLHSPIGAWSGAYGLQIGGRDFLAIGDEAFIPPVDTESAGIFLVERYESQPWNLEFGVRYETQEHRPINAASVDDSAISLSAAAVRDFGRGLSLALNLASAERLPAAEELFADGPHLATNLIEIGDPSLRSETSTHFDIGIRQSVGDLTWRVTVFATEYDDFISLSDTGIEDPVEALPVFRYSQSNASFYGIEAEFFVPVAEIGEGEVDLRVFGDLVGAELDSGEDVPRIPPRRYGVRLAYHNDRFSAGLEATRYDAQNAVAAFESPTRGYTLAGFDLEWTVGSNPNANVSLFVRGSNLLDEDARRHASLVKDIAPLPGRNVTFGLRASL